MSAITREEKIELVRSVLGPNADALSIGGGLTVAERVAALVEERMKETVCSVCGVKLHSTMLHPTWVVDTCVLGNWKPVTRAQFDAEREHK